MSQENVAIVRKFFDDLARGDLEAAGALLSADVEWDTYARGFDGSVVYGPEAVINVIRDWLEVWEQVSFELADVQAAGDRVAAHPRQHARGKGSGIQGEVHAFAIFKVADGKVAAYREYATWSECLKAVGLEE